MVSDVKTCSFITKSTEILAGLQERVRFNNWMVTRLVGDHLVVVNAIDKTGYTRIGAWTKWSDSLCSIMVSGEVPDFVPRCDEIEPYAKVLATRKETISAYLGVPIRSGSGRLIGTLCATHDQPAPNTITDHRLAVLSCADELGSLYSVEIDRQKGVRRLLLSSVSRANKTRGVLDSTAWSIVTKVEEARHNVLRHPVAFGAVLVCPCQSEATASHLHSTLGPTNALTSFGPGQFLFMITEFDDASPATLDGEVRSRMAEAKVESETNVVVHPTVEHFATTIAKTTQAPRQPLCRKCAA